MLVTVANTAASVDTGGKEDGANPMSATHLEPAAKFHFDSEAGGDHAAELYKAAAVAPLSDAVDAQSDAARAHYREHGWLAVRALFSPAETTMARHAIDDLAHRRVPGFDGIMYEGAMRDVLGSMAPTEQVSAVRKLFRFVPHEPRMAALSRQDAMLAVVRSVLGTANPALLQDMALLKPPRIGREKPWHQDHAFFNYGRETRFVGVWIALDPATLENGCMHVQDRGHQDGPRVHFRRRDVQICDAEMLGRGTVAFPLEPGDAMFFDGLLPHGTPANTSSDRRRALQFHYVAAEAAEVDEKVRLALFGAEGTGATC
jgi:phytanoyl-CoA hydroxylase